MVSKRTNRVCARVTDKMWSDLMISKHVYDVPPSDVFHMGINEMMKEGIV